MAAERYPVAEQKGQGHPLEPLALAAVLTLLAAAGCLWLTGELAGRLFGGAWPQVSFAQMGEILVALAHTPADPAQAWPPPARALLPGPLGIYATLALLLTLPATLAAAALSRRRRHRPAVAVARWARRRDLRPLAVRRPQPGRLTLGRAHGRLLAAEPRQSLLVLGPTQTLKTTGFAIPAILEWAGPVLATSVKSDLVRDTLAHRTSRGEVWIYDPTAATGLPAAGWTPLSGCRRWQDAQRTASWLADTARHGATLDGADFWYATAAKLLAPLLYAAARSGLMIADVVRWVDRQEEHEVRQILEALGPQEALTAAEASWLRDPKTRSGVYTTAETVLAAYADPDVSASAEHADIRPQRLLDGGQHTLYVCAPAHEQRRLRPLLATLVHQQLAAGYERATHSGQPLHPPLLLVLDEAANIAPLRELDAVAATAAAHGIQLVTVFHDLAQIHAVYGRDRAATILSNHRAKIIASGIADPHSSDYLARLLGDQQIQHHSATSGSGGHHSTTDSTAYRSLAPANLLRELQPGHGLLVYGHLPPARLTLRPWFRDRHLRALVRTAPTNTTRTAKAHLARAVHRVRRQAPVPRRIRSHTGRRRIS